MPWWPLATHKAPDIKHSVGCHTVVLISENEKNINIHNSFIHNSEKVEITQMSTSNK
jgi:hypothetical protein